MHTVQILTSPPQSFAGRRLRCLDRRQLEKIAEADIDLKALLSCVEKGRCREVIQAAAQIKEMVMPYLQRAKSLAAGTSIEPHLEMLEKNLLEITSPFCAKLSSHYAHLSPPELRVADFVRHGRTTKEIASLLNVSSKTVSAHRGNIRAKLGLNGSPQGLRSYLLSLEKG